VRSEAKRSRGFTLPAGRGFLLVLLLVEALAVGTLPVGDDLEELETLDPRFAEVIRGVVALLVVEGDQDVRDLDLLLAGGLGLEDGALDDALEAGRLDGLDVLDLGDLLLEVGLHAPPQLLHVGLACLEDGPDLFEGERGVEDMLRREVLVVAELRLVVRGVEYGLDFLADLHTFYAFSMVHLSGKPFCRANWCT
jgi:hypothetical protein